MEQSKKKTKAKHTHRTNHYRVFTSTLHKQTVQCGASYCLWNKQRTHNIPARYVTLFNRVSWKTSYLQMPTCK